VYLKTMVIALYVLGQKGEKIKEARGAGSVSPSLPPKAYEVS
jgi:hypothetical protein